MASKEEKEERAKKEAKALKNKEEKARKERVEFKWMKELYRDDRDQKWLDTLKNENDTLKIISKELRLRLDKHIQDQTELIALLNGEITEKNSNIARLSARRDALDEEYTNLLEEHERDRAQKKHDHEANVLELEAKMMESTLTYQALMKFKKQKAELLKRLEEYKKALADEKEERAANVKALNDRNMMEKDRLKNEMLRKIRETKLSLLAMTEDQLHTTTKRTILENEQMTTELQYQSSEGERIAQQNKRLIEDNKAMRKQIAEQEEAQKQLATKTRFLQKLIGKIEAEASVEKKSAGKSKPKLSRSRRQQEETKLLMDKEAEIRLMEDRVKDLEDMVEAARLKAQRTQDKVEATKSQNERLLMLQSEATEFVEKCIKDLFTSAANTGENVGNDDLEPQVTSLPSKLDEMDTKKRYEFLRLLRNKLKRRTGGVEASKRAARATVVPSLPIDKYDPASASQPMASGRASGRTGRLTSSRTGSRGSARSQTFSSARGSASRATSSEGVRFPPVADAQSA